MAYDPSLYIALSISIRTSQMLGQCMYGILADLHNRMDGIRRSTKPVPSN